MGSIIPALQHAQSSRGSIDQHRFLVPQILGERVNPGPLGTHGSLAWLLHHLVINESLANVPDLNVAVIGFPELTFCEWW